MDKHPPDFTEELVDAQIDWLLADQSQSQTDSPNKRIVDDLQQIYQDDERSLHKVWLRLGLEESQQSMEHPENKYSGDASDKTYKMQRSASARPSTERPRPMQQVQKRSLVHGFSLIAAVSTLVLIIGSFLLVFNLIHLNQGTNIATNVKTQNIYASDGTSVFMLNTQTHQTIWKKPFTNVEKIIREGQALYIMQVNLGRGEPNTVLKIDASNGQTLWKHSFPTRQGSGDVILTDMLLLNGQLYISARGHNDNPVLETSIPISILNTTNGNQIKTNPGEKDVLSMVLYNDVLATSSLAGIRVSDIIEGRLLWQKPFLPEFVGQMQIANGLLYAIVTDNDGNGGPMTSTIRAYEISNGHQVWKSPDFASDALYSFAVDKNTVYFGTTSSPQPGQKKPTSGRVYAFDTQLNKQLWSVPVAGATLHQIFLANGVVYVAADSGAVDNLAPAKAHIIALDATTGATRWQQILAENYIAGFFMDNGAIYVGSYNIGQHSKLVWGKSYAFSAANGTRLWEDGQHHLYIIVPVA